MIAIRYLSFLSSQFESLSALIVTVKYNYIIIKGENYDKMTSNIFVYDQNESRLSKYR